MGKFYEIMFSQAACPRGFWGGLMARWLMPMAHMPFYKSTATTLNLQPEDDYLEIAIGSGVFIKKYASHVKSVTGLDYSKDMVEMAAKVNRKLIKAGTADFQYGDACQLPWEDNRFSAGAVIGAFEFFSKPAESIKELHRVLHPGGRLVITTGMHADDGQDHTKEKSLGMKCYTADEIETMFREAGFEEVTKTLSSSKYSKGHPDIMTIHGIK